LYIWDDEIEGHPPYVRPVLAHATEASSSSLKKLPCDCNCEEVKKDFILLMKDMGINKNEKLKKKLQQSRKKSNLFMILLILSWVFFALFVMNLS
jgi:hypothetical protein